MHQRSLTVYRRLFTYVRPFWLMLLLGVTTNIFYSSIDAGFTYLIKPTMDRSFVAHDLAFIRWIPWVVLFGITLRGLASGFGEYCMTYVARHVVTKLRQRAFSQMLCLPATAIDRLTSGQLLSQLLYDVEQVAQVSADALTTFVQSICLIFGLLGVMFFISWPLATLFLMTTPLLGLIVSVTNRKTRKVSHALQRSMGRVTDIATEVIEGYQVVRMCGGQLGEQSRFDRATRDARKRDMKVATIKLINTVGVQLVVGIGISSIVVAAILLSKHQEIGAGGFVSMLAAMLQLIKPVKNLSTVNSIIQRGLAGAESVFRLFDMQKEPQGGQTPSQEVKGKIDFHRVSFAYAGKPPVLREFELSIAAGKTVALVGTSGSGKTTVAQLLPRFYEIDMGEITIDGQPIRHFSLAYLRAQIAYVSQHVTLFNDTVAANIAYGLHDVSLARLQTAAKQSFAHDFITALPQAYDTVIGENGMNLSGGQRQRIAIARALLRDPPILILDEATSALDNEAERSIQQLLTVARQGRTTLVIAHRLSTIENADWIVVMAKGRIVEQGQHSQLLQLGGAYSNLYQANVQQIQPTELAHA